MKWKIHMRTSARLHFALDANELAKSKENRTIAQRIRKTAQFQLRKFHSLQIQFNILN